MFICILIDIVIHFKSTCYYIDILDIVHDTSIRNIPYLSTYDEKSHLGFIMPYLCVRPGA